jgi:hypothetical protein
MMILKIKLPIQLHKLLSLVTQTLHDMISDSVLPQMALQHTHKSKEKRYAHTIVTVQQILAVVSILK